MGGSDSHLVVSVPGREARVMIQQFSLEGRSALVTGGNADGDTPKTSWERLSSLPRRRARSSPA